MHAAVHTPVDKLNSDGPTPKLVRNWVFYAFMIVPFMQRSSEHLGGIVEHRRWKSLSGWRLKGIPWLLCIWAEAVHWKRYQRTTTCTSYNDYTPNDGDFLFRSNVAVTSHTLGCTYQVEPDQSAYSDILSTNSQMTILAGILLPCCRSHCQDGLLAGISATFSVLRGFFLLRPMVVDDSSSADLYSSVKNPPVRRNGAANIDLGDIYSADRPSSREATSQPPERPVFMPAPCATAVLASRRPPSCISSYRGRHCTPCWLLTVKTDLASTYDQHPNIQAATHSVQDHLSLNTALPAPQN